MKRKNCISIILALSLLSGLTACSGEQTRTTEPEKGAETGGETTQAQQTETEIAAQTAEEFTYSAASGDCQGSYGSQ